MFLMASHPAPGSRPPRGAGPAAPPHLDPDERARLAEHGYLLREAVFDASELARLGEDCETLVARVTEADPGTPRIPAGSYLFQPHPALCTIVKWEPERQDVVQGVEPFAHFDATLRDWGLDPRLTAPMQDLLGAEAVELFTEKLNLKRAKVGGAYVLHQDYPYWRENSQDPGEIATALVFLDDAHRGNGGLEVLPGSHRGGVREGRTARGFAAHEMQSEGFDTSGLVALEAPAGSVVYFGSLLVHRSMPNRSERDRRTLLYSYQPAGRTPSHVHLAGMLRR